MLPLGKRPLGQSAPESGDTKRHADEIRRVIQKNGVPFSVLVIGREVLDSDRIGSIHRKGMDKELRDSVEEWLEDKRIYELYTLGTEGLGTPIMKILNQISMWDVLKAMQTCLQGLRFFHRRGKVFGDLQAGNMFWDDGDATLCIVDFGMMCHVKDFHEKFVRGLGRRRGFMPENWSPEMYLVQATRQVQSFSWAQPPP